MRSNMSSQFLFLTSSVRLEKLKLWKLGKERKGIRQGRKKKSKNKTKNQQGRFLCYSNSHFWEMRNTDWTDSHIWIISVKRSWDCEEGVQGNARQDNLQARTTRSCWIAFKWKGLHLSLIYQSFNLPLPKKSSVEIWVCFITRPITLKSVIQQ